MVIDLMGDVISQSRVAYFWVRQLSGWLALEAALKERLTCSFKEISFWSLGSQKANLLESKVPLGPTPLLQGMQISFASLTASVTVSDI